MSSPKLKYADFKGPAKQLEDLDLPRIAHEIGCGEDEVHMLMDVESAGDGFDNQGRPKALYEPHIMFKELTKRGDKAGLAEAMKLGLAYKTWKTKPYPKDSYPNLIKACAINLEAALCSTSWGAEQMMGFNFKSAGYANVVEMVNAHCDDEENHIQSMINFCEENDLADDLQRLGALTRPTTPADCAPIARVYNGASYAENKYHIKLAAAHNKWRKIPDTAWTPDSPTGPIIVAQGKSTAGLSESDIRGAQQMLKDKGYVEVGRIDGILGTDTATAINAFQVVEGLPVDGKLTRELIEKIKLAKMRPVSEARASATQADVVENAVPAVASTVKSASLIKTVGMSAMSLFGVGSVIDGDVPDLDQFSSSLSKTQLIMNMIGDKLPWVIGLVAAGLVVYYGQKILSRQIEGYRKGMVK